MSEFAELVKGRQFDRDLSALEHYYLVEVLLVIKRSCDGACHNQPLVDTVLALRELADLRERVKALESFTQHTDECAMTSAVVGDGGKIVHEAKPCTCGLAKLMGDTNHTPKVVVPQDEIVDPGGMVAQIEFARFLSGMTG